MRLGVDAAVVDGARVPGDVEVAGGVVARTGLEAAGSGHVACPGLVDLQVNGFAGIDLLSAGAGDVHEIARRLAATGVTAWQPSLISAPGERTLQALRAIGGAAGDQGSGEARILGVHLEGPFLAPGHLGVHPAEHRRDPDPALLGRLLDAGPVTCVTLAPELPGALTMVDRLRERGVTVALGHSGATAARAHGAFDRGARTVTHLFNAMGPLHHREPGLAGAALVRDDVIVQVIVDGHHLADDTVRLAWRAAAGRLALVTDAVAAAGGGEPTGRVGAHDVVVRDGAARRPDGTLAGSVLTMRRAVANLVALGVPLESAVEAASRVPARVLDREDVGRLREGAVADVVVLDERLQLRRVLRAGRDVDPAPEAADPG